jgi:hypothetical protein
VGHTHEDVDQMFSRFSWALKHHVVRSVIDLARVLKDSYAPTPHVEMLDHVMDWDIFKGDIGYKVLAGMSGQHDAAQEEKIHAIRLKLDVNGVAKMYWKRMVDDPLWAPSDGRNVLLSYKWPTEIPTKPIKQAIPDVLLKLENTLSLLTGSYMSQGKDDMIKSWRDMLSWMENPPVVSLSPTWIEFNRVFCVTDKLIEEGTPGYIWEDGPPTSKQRDARRQEMAGMLPESISERARQAAMREEGDAEESGRLEVEVAQHDDALIQHNYQKRVSRTFSVVVGQMYALCTDDDFMWWPVKVLEVVSATEIKCQYYFTNQTRLKGTHTGDLKACTVRNGFSDPYVTTELEAFCASPLNIENKRIHKPAYRNVSTEAASLRARVSATENAAAIRAEKDAKSE